MILFKMYIFSNTFSFEVAELKISRIAKAAKYLDKAGNFYSSKSFDLKYKITKMFPLEQSSIIFSSVLC
jgi:hypothetical protein